MNTTTEQYKKYIEIQLSSHNDYRHELKNHSKEGHRYDISNVILMNMVKSLNCTNGTVLDLGCCEGFHTEELQELFGDAHGIDINTESLGIAHSFGRNYCIQGDIHKIPFEDHKFDLIFSHEVLEHSLDFNLVLSEVYRVLKPNGYLVFSVPCREGLNSNRQENDGAHYSVMTPFKVKQKMIQNKLIPIKGIIFNIPQYNTYSEWNDYEMNYPFYPHLHAIVRKQ